MALSVSINTARLLRIKLQLPAVSPYPHLSTESPPQLILVTDGEIGPPSRTEIARLPLSPRRYSPRAPFPPPVDSTYL
ncbi:hypothetical protein TgHK011_005994 [Trichoderma gracile]|nr:hypothetical protein TgHK011_005994 [Trichoderma gracile]